MMVIKNNYCWFGQIEENTPGFIANGEIIDIISVRNFEERYGLNLLMPPLDLRITMVFLKWS